MYIELNHGGGGAKSSELIKEVRKILGGVGKWQNSGDDSASLALSKIISQKSDLHNQHILLTTDAFIVDPIFFPGGDIGKIAVCGTINDLAVMGAKPLGISLSIVV